jgi:ipoprotein LpqH
VVKRGILVGIAGAAMVVAGLAGCSSNKSNTSKTSSSSPTSAQANAQQVIVDGQNQNVTGKVTCTPANGNINIGIGDPTDGIGAVVTDANPPFVHSVGLGTPNGITLGYADSANQGSAQATKNGHSYKITGTATGVDTNSQQQVSKPFEIDVTCP